MNDGPQGFRDNNHPQTTTAWPSGLTMAASWDTEAMFEWGKGMGKEFFEKGSNVQLGPGLCVARVPRNGRNFEYLSGEDPYLGYKLVQPVIKGIQSQKVVANAKHYILNNQETNRMGVSAETDERTRFEMYYPPFEGAIEADVGSFMCGYNKINGDWSCENPVTLKHDLKEVMGFKGYVMSDWGATHSTSLMRGLDMEMPGAGWMNPELIKPAMDAGTITQDAIDEAVTRILTPMFAVGVMDEPVSTWDWKKLANNVTTDASVTSARRLSALSTVLLKNKDGVLPLQQDKSFALIGFAGDNAVVHGGGSGSVVPSFVSTPLQGVTAAAGAKAKIVVNNGTDIASAAADAAAADYVIVFAGTLSGEGGDRASLSLDDGCNEANAPEPTLGKQCAGNAHNQTQLIEAIAKANSKTVVVMSVPGAVTTPWADQVSAILTNFMPGQQSGNAIADVLFGAVNPSAKLPLTFPNGEDDLNLSPAQWPGLPDPKNPAYAYYTEKLLVGYRHYDAHVINFTTGFPFGHGLSYTTFGYSNIAVEKKGGNFEVTFTVKNTGKVPGAEVAQLYLHFPTEAGEPVRQLKGFQKTEVLAAGESQSITLTLRPRELSIWDTTSHAWQVVKGNFDVSIGSSSRDFRLYTSFSTTGNEGASMQSKLFV